MNIGKPHLYIILFNDNQHLKVGISLNNNFNRIKQLTSIYDINHDNIILYSSDNISNIKLIEKNIKTIINETITPDNIHYGKDIPLGGMVSNETQAKLIAIEILKQDYNINYNIDDIKFEWGGYMLLKNNTFFHIIIKKLFLNLFYKSKIIEK
jgi:hypothetical protein